MKNFEMKQVAIATLLILAMPLAQADDWTGSIGGSIGSKHLDDGDWSSLDDHDAVGLVFEIKKESWPLSITYDIFGSGDVDKKGEIKDESFTVDNHIGVRKTFELTDSKMRPYIGGGITQTYAEIKNKTATTTVKDDDDGVGYWLGAGWNVGVTEHFDIGFDVRYSEVEVTLFDRDLEAGGMHYAATASYRW